MTAAPPASPPVFVQDPRRGPFNAAFFDRFGPVIDRALRRRKALVYADLPDRVVEIGSGVGANLRYLAPGSTLVAVEPNRAMHARLRADALWLGIRLELHERMAESTGLPDSSADVVISSLVLCSVADPEAVLAEVRRVLRPGGTFRFLEHVVAERGTFTRVVQRLLRRPWAWVFEGCSCERDLESAVRAAGFASIEVERYRIRTPFVPFNTHIAGMARA